MNSVYLDTARLLTQVAPLVLVDDTFALKGGTAINLFLRDMPRLSVDLDLVFIDYELPRDQALIIIKKSLRQAAERLTARGFQTREVSADPLETKLLVRRGSIGIKIEANLVLRGTVNPIQQATLAPAARDVLMADLSIPVVSLEDLYGGKLVAALDRQHPRDLFDVMQLFEREGITPAIRHAFVAYLASHNRPIHEVLFPKLRNIEYDYRSNFDGMTADPVAIDALLAARDRLIKELQQGLDENERQFLISLVSAEPDWSLMRIEHLPQLPGIRWKLRNLEQLKNLNPKKFDEQASILAIKLATIE